MVTNKMGKILHLGHVYALIHVSAVIICLKMTRKINRTTVPINKYCSTGYWLNLNK
jgi:hypothetical protein